MKWFRSGLSPHQTALAMLGAKAGQAAAFLGAGNPALSAEIARVTGLNGRTVVVDEGDQAGQAVEAAAAEAGALVEFVDAPVTAVPLEADGFDLIAVHARLALRTDESRLEICREAFRLLRPGGRIILIEEGTRRGWFQSGQTAALPADAARSLLDRCGARAGRRLADAAGFTYDEALKPALVEKEDMKR